MQVLRSVTPPPATQTNLDADQGRFARNLMVARKRGLVALSRLWPAAPTV